MLDLEIEMINAKRVCISKYKHTSNCRSSVLKDCHSPIRLRFIYCTDVTEEQIQSHRESLISSYNEQNYNNLRNQCRVNNLNAKGKKSELVERLAERTLTVEYGSPRMRNSYQTAMNSPLPITKKDTQPKSLQSVSSMFFFRCDVF